MHQDLSMPTGSTDQDSKDEATIVRFASLEPQWHAPRAKEPGFMRWLIRWIGGPESHGDNLKPGPVINNNAAVGYMYMPIGQRQSGLHTHTVAEIYIILKGQLLGVDGKGHEHMAGPMDCVYIPAGVPHGVRTYGSEDLELIWVHDGIEPRGASIYFEPGDVLPETDAQISVVKLMDLEPSWDDMKAKEPGYMRWMVSWVGGGTGFVNHNPTHSVHSEKIGLSLTVVLPGHKQVRHSNICAETYIVVDGIGVINRGHGNQELGKLDAIYFPAHSVHSIRNHGTVPLCLVCVQEMHIPIGSTMYFSSIVASKTLTKANILYY